MREICLRLDVTMPVFVPWFVVDESVPAGPCVVVPFRLFVRGPP